MGDDWMVRGLLFIYGMRMATRDGAAAVVKGDSNFFEFLKLALRASCHTVPSPRIHSHPAGRPCVVGS